jgi:hypothetical protein
MVVSTNTSLAFTKVCITMGRGIGGRAHAGRQYHMTPAIFLYGFEGHGAQPGRVVAGLMFIMMVAAFPNIFTRLKVEIS